MQGATGLTNGVGAQLELCEARIETDCIADDDGGGGVESVLTERQALERLVGEECLANGRAA